MTALTVRLHEWSTVDPLSDEGAALRNRRLADASTRELACALKHERVLDVTELYGGLSVRAFSHVGRVQLGDLEVTVEPKLGATELLGLLRYAYGLRNLRVLQPVAFKGGGDLLADLVVTQLYDEARELVGRGLAKRYIGATENLQEPRGRIEMNRLAKPGALLSAALPCRHHLRSSNVLLNQVLRAGLSLAARVARDPRLRGDVVRLAGSLRDSADTVVLSSAVLRETRRNLNRLVVAYEPALALIELLYQGSSTTLENGATLSLPGFLFDMNRFFQALVERFLSENLHGYEVRSEEALREMLDYMPSANPRARRAPRPRPDFMVVRGRRVKQLLDAKYRDLWERELPRDMLYQLSVYALSQPTGSTAAILYPTTDPVARDAIIEIRDPSSGAARGYVALRPVVLQRLLDAVGTEAGPVLGSELARVLAFGAHTHDGRGSSSDARERLSSRSSA
jgi:5-methylcytosine-specific restriction enzyme subunit McrC